MRLVKCPLCSSLPEGTVDTIPAVAYVTEGDGNTLEYSGESRVCWNQQMPEKDDYGLTYFWCARCDRRFAAYIDEDMNASTEVPPRP